MGMKFFRKNILDLSNTLPTFTVTDAVASNTGQDFISLMRNRNNFSGWSTTGSTDAANTTMVIEFGETREFDHIILVGHNLKAYTLKYWDGAAWADFSTPVAPTNNAATTTYHTFTSVSATKIQLVITGTMVANADKYIKQFIVCEILGTFNVEPEYSPKISKDRRVTKYLSGKSFIAKTTGAFMARVRMKVVSNDNDLDLVETLFQAYEGFLFWPCGGDVSQFETIREGYRLQDIYFVDLSNEYEPEFNDSRWNQGLPIDLRLVEVV